MGKFSRQSLYSILNRLFPPSSTQIHQPSILTDSVQLIHPAFSNSHWLDGVAIEQFTSAAGATTIATSIVPSGRFRIVLAAYGFVTFSAVAKSYGITVFDPGTALDVYVDSPVPIHQSVLYAAAYGGVVAALNRPIIVPQGTGLALNATAADAAQVLSLRYQFRELSVGDPF